jgi:uncharacterized CHY-type Zn-finger protein
MATYRFFSAFLLVSAFLLITCGQSKSEEKPPPGECFESRISGGYANITKTEIKEGRSNVRCSDFTGGVLWYGDPYTDTVPMGGMPTEEEGLYRHEGEMPAEGESIYAHKVDYLHAEAVVRARIPHLKYYPCTICHDGKSVKVPENINPRMIMMHKDIVPDSLQLRHGHGRLWCLNCHNRQNRDMLIDHFGNPVSYDQPQLLCGKCHGQVFHDWRQGIHGKRSGSWETNGKKRWWTCTECHNPHEADIRPYHTISPERAPALPKGVTSAAHEKAEEEERKAEAHKAEAHE